MLCSNFFASRCSSTMEDNPHHIRRTTANSRHADHRDALWKSIELMITRLRVAAEPGKPERVEKVVRLLIHGSRGALKWSVTWSIVLPLAFMPMSAWRGPSSMSRLAFIVSICFFSSARDLKRL